MIHESFKAPIEIVEQYKPKVEYKLAGMERPRRGHLIFEFEFDTGILKVITPEPENIQKTTTTPQMRRDVLPGVPIEQTTKRIKIHRKPGCLYFSRLNYESAFKYLRKLMPGITFEQIP